MSERGLFKRGNKWCIQYFFNGKRYRETVGESKSEAAALSARKTQIKEGKFFLIKNRSCTTPGMDLLPIFTIWAEKNLKPKSYSRYLTNIAKLTPYFKGKRLIHITPKMIEYFKMKRIDKDEVSPATVNRDLACLKRMFNLAIKWDFAETNPVVKVAFLKRSLDVFDILLMGRLKGCYRFVPRISETLSNWPSILACEKVNFFLLNGVILTWKIDC